MKAFLVAQVATRTRVAGAAGERDSFELRVAIYSRSPRARPARGPFVFVEDDGDVLSQLEAGSLGELCRLVLAHGELAVNGEQHLVRALFREAGLDLDEARLDAFEEALEAIAVLGDERRRRAREREA